MYIPSYIASYFTEAPLQVVEDVKGVTVSEKTAQSDTPLLTEDGVAVAPDPEVIAEQITFEEKITLKEKDYPPWKILAFGAPSAKHRIASTLTFLINAAFIALTADALFRARWFYPADDLSFVRLGHVSHNEAKFLIREPDQAKMPVTLQIHAKDSQPTFDNLGWADVGTVAWTSNTTDFTAPLTVPLTHNLPKIYQWRTSNNHSGEFHTALKPGQMPQDNDRKFTFLSTSCILPRFPYSPLDHPLAIPGLRHLAEKLPELGAQFMLFLGDFIYVDVPERFGKSVEEYRMQYRQVYASPDYTAVAQNLSWIHVLDDHEISNDWSSNTTGMYRNAVEPWHLYQANLNPPMAVVANTNLRREAATWFEFVQGPASFFMMDTRTYRSSNNFPFEDTKKTMLGQEQLSDLLYWLERPEPQGVKWKIIASSVPFTKNWPVNVKDTWGGFLVERRKVLEAMWDAGARGTGVIILSGDRHEFAATRFPPPPESRWPETAAAHEFSTSPLNQFASPIPSYRQTDDDDVMLK